MITIPEVLEKMVLQAPFLEEGLALGIVNLSALARHVQPQVEKAVKKNVQVGAIVMALKRLGERLQIKQSALGKVMHNLGDLTVRSNLLEFTFQASDSLLEKQKKLLHAIENRRDVFITQTQGVAEVTMILSANLAVQAETIFKDEKTISRLTQLSAVTIRLPAKVVGIPGVHYSLLKQLAWFNINVVEVVSTLTELTIILHQQDVDQAFSILKSYL